MGTERCVQAVVGLTGLAANTGDPRISATAERFVRMELPDPFTDQHALLMQKDLEALARIAADHPQELAEVHNAALANDFGRATAAARRIGLTEEHLRSQGGAEIAVAAGILLVLVVYAVVSGSDSPPPPQPPPLPEGGPPPVDAGTG
jgi:hypothetical protein